MNDSKYRLKHEDIQSMDVNQDTINKLKQLLPEVFTEGERPVLDIEKLKIVLGELVDIEEDNKTRYSFNWSGKKQAQAEANKPSGATLRPCIDESKNWDNTKNIYIEGDNLEVLKLLQKSYYNQVKMIYIDPPYNTGKDFVYKDNYHDNVKNYLQLTGQVDNDGNRMDTNTDKNGRFHTDWLNMIYPRLKLARNLLRDDGVIFISIDDNEVHNLRKICDEIFGEDNFVGCFGWLTKQAARGVPPVSMVMSNHEYIICYKKHTIKFKGVERDEADFHNPDNDIRGLWRSESMNATGSSGNLFSITDPGSGRVFRNSWAFSELKVQEMIKDNLILFPSTDTGIPRQKKFMNSYLNERKAFVTYLGWFSTENSTKALMNLFENIKIFDFSKPTDLIKFLINQATSTNDIILDFFSGSATTAHAVMELNAEDGGNRKYICVQLPEITKLDSEAYKAGYKNICEIGKERIRRAGDKILTEYNAKRSEDLLTKPPTKALDIGFRVFKLDTSNFKPFDENNLFADNMIVDGRSSLDIFYEVVLKQGYFLDLVQTVLNIGDTKCYAMGDIGGVLVLVVLDDEVKTNFGLKLFDYQVRMLIIKDSCFTNDEIKLNTLATIEQLESKDNPIQIRII